MSPAEVAAMMPPLSDAQVAKIATLLAGVEDGGGQ